MKISPRTIRQLAQIVTGDTKLAPYRSGPDLVRLFNEFGANDFYGKEFPTRWRYAEEKITALLATAAFPKFITHIFDPREFVGTSFEPQPAVDHINEFLKFDGLKIVKDGDFYRLRGLGGASVDFTSPFSGSEKLTHVFVDEQIAKCDEKLARDDYDGAITNARSLVEAVLIELERRFDPPPPAYDGEPAKTLSSRPKTTQTGPGSSRDRERSPPDSVRANEHHCWNRGDAKQDERRARADVQAGEASCQPRGQCCENSR